MTKQLAIAMRDYFLKHGEEELTALWEEAILECEVAELVAKNEHAERINLMNRR